MPGGKTLTISNIGLIPDPLQKTESAVDSTSKVNQKIPGWIKNNAKWWAEGTIGDSDFTGGIQHLIQEKIIDIPDLPEQTTDTAEEKVPDWVRNNAKWWADGIISEDDFLNGIKYMVEKGIVRVSAEESTSSTTSATVKIPSGVSSNPYACAETFSCFIPFEVQIGVGGTVTWINEDGAFHPIASWDDDTGRSTGEFEFGLGKGDTYEYTFDTAGEYRYVCTYHPWEEGIVQVS